MISLNIPFILFPLLIAVAGWLAFGLYKIHRPVLGSAVVRIFTLLRFTVIFLLLILLLRPWAFISRTANQYPKLAVFYDHSISIGTTNNEENRLDSVKAALAMAGKYNMPYQVFAFGSEVSARSGLGLPDTLQPETDFSNLLEFISRQSFDQVLLVSDGRMTDPVFPLIGPSGLPVIHTLLLGRITPPTDLAITYISGPETWSAGREGLLKIGLSATNLEREQAVELSLPGQTSRLIRYPAGKSEQEVQFNFTPPRAGLHLLNFRLAGLAAENNLQNNQQSLTIRVRPAKLNILLVSDRPDLDSRFMARILNSNDDTACHLYWPQLPSTKPPSGYQADLLILHGFNQQPDVQTLTTQYLKPDNRPVFIIGGSAASLTAMARSLGIDYQTSPAGETEISGFTPHETVRFVYPEVTASDFFWSRLAPLNQSGSLTALKPDDALLIASRERPVVWKNAPDKVFFFGRGFWKWHFLNAGQPSAADGFARFIHDLVWNTFESQSVKRFEIVADKTEMLSQEINHWQVNQRQTLPGAARLMVRLDSTVLYDGALGDYNREQQPGFRIYRPGPATLSARLLLDGQTIEADSVSLAVQAVGAEFTDLSASPLLLKKISQTSGGKFIRLSGLDSLMNAWAGSAVPEIKKQEIDLRYSYIVIGLILTLLIVEWYMRRKKQLI